MDLNEAQKKVVEHSGGPILVVAGPGTGKTRTLTHRIAHLVKERGVDPGSILAITFTNRAAKEMRERLDALLGGEKGFIGTFHALGLEIVRREAGLLGFSGTPLLYGEEDRKALLKEMMKEIHLREGKLPVERVWEGMESCINRDIPVKGMEAGYLLEDVYRLYTRSKREEGALDFNDLLVMPLRLFEERPDRLEVYRARFRHLFIDEYQDVNTLQVKLVRLLGEGADSLMAIGDPDQAIYSFRGSDVRNFMSFPETFAGAEVHSLSDNYRSSVTILSASGQVIRKNRDRHEQATPTRSVGEKGLLLDHRVLPTEKAEASFAAHEIQKLTGGLGRYGLEESFERGERDFGFSDLAVLYRLNAQARELENALDKAGIPFQRVGAGSRGRDPLERLVLAAARLSVNPGNRAAWRILAELGGGRGGALVQPQAAEKNALFTAAVTLSKSMPGEMEALLDAAQRLTRHCELESLPIEEFLHGAPLTLREDPFDARSEKVTLSTLHAAKGLEFPVVFIVGMDEGIVPFIRDDEGFPEAALEEERRLLYVGMTRAGSVLYLTRARRRFLFGQRIDDRPSPFLDHISGDLVSFVREAPRPPKAKEDDGQMSLF